MTILLYSGINDSAIQRYMTSYYTAVYDDSVIEEWHVDLLMIVSVLQLTGLCKITTRRTKTICWVYVTHVISTVYPPLSQLTATR